MDFYAVFDEVIRLLQQRGHASYRALQLQFQLDDDQLEILKDELLESQQVLVERDGTSLMWRDVASSHFPRAPVEIDRERELHLLVPVVIALLRCEGRVTYGRLKQVFMIGDALVMRICDELQFRGLARDLDRKGLMWLGAERLYDASETVGLTVDRAVSAVLSMSNASLGTLNPAAADAAEYSRPAGEAERRQLTVMFCDLVGSTQLSGQLDPEDLRDVVRAYQETAAQVIQRYEGHIAQYLGDGLLVYFGFPSAHENDAARAVHTGLEIIEAIGALNQRLRDDFKIQLGVRLGIHTGPVVVGEMGGGDRQEQLALGATPNIAARLEGLAQANTVIVSSSTERLVQDDFILNEPRSHQLKGVSEPMVVFQVAGPREVDDDTTHTWAGGLRSLVGRDEEMGLLLRRWEQSKEGLGQVALLSGEAGIGKSSLVEHLRHHVHQENCPRLTFRCSPYHQNSVMHPIIDFHRRALDWQPDDTAETQLTKLEQALHSTKLALREAIPLLAALLSLAVPEGRYPALPLDPQLQRQQTQDILVAWLLEQAEPQPVLVVWEDLHWADPSTLELLGLFVEQAPTASLLHLLTFRPTFTPSWTMRSHMTSITLNQLERPQTEALVAQLAHGKPLPDEVIQHIVEKTDGIPLFVEELTKMLLESDLLRESDTHYELTGSLATMAIPTTLQDSLMARLDQLPAARDVAQIGAALGREFSYEMVEAVSSLDSDRLRVGLAQLVDAELLYQRGRPPRAQFIFKHALIQDAAYQSLLRRLRQQLHERIAQVLEAQFPELVQTQPERVAQHYTEAACPAQAVTYWLRAGERAREHSAPAEAIGHLTTGVNLVVELPESSERMRQELQLQLALGSSWLMSRGHTAPEVLQAYNRARELSGQLGETSDLVPVLFGLWRFYVMRGEHRTAQDIGDEILRVAELEADDRAFVAAAYTRGFSAVIQGDFITARTYLEAGVARYRPDPTEIPFGGQDPGVGCYLYLAFSFWFLGYPEQSRARAREALALSHELNHPFTLAWAQIGLCFLYQWEGERQDALAESEASFELSTQHHFSAWINLATLLKDSVRAALTQEEAVLEQARHALDAYRQTMIGTVPMCQAVFADACCRIGKIEEGLSVIETTLVLVETHNERLAEVSLYCIKGDLLLQQTGRPPLPNSTGTPRAMSTPEACFRKALEVARGQEAKSLELQAATRLARLWRDQGRKADARDLLAPIYDWFTEGFNTVDLKEAKELLEALSE